MQAGSEVAARDDRYARLIQAYAETVFQAGMDAYQSRQAEMIAQWKEAATKDGWATYGMWFWQLSEASLSVSTALNDMMPEQTGFKSELTSLTKGNGRSGPHGRGAQRRDGRFTPDGGGDRYPKFRELAGRPERSARSTTRCRAGAGFLRNDQQPAQTIERQNSGGISLGAAQPDE